MMIDNVMAASQNSAPASGHLFNARFDQLKTALRREWGDTPFRTWIQPLTFTSFSNGVLTLAAPTRFIRDWVKTHYADNIIRLWGKMSGPCVRLEWSAQAAAPAPAAIVFDSADIANENETAAESIHPADDISSPLDPRFTFENFVSGPSNELAQAAARRVAESASVPFNPLFLQGGVGHGKTHLMQAAAQAIRARHPGRRVVYMSAEKFMFQFVRALRSRDTMTFKEQFRAIDVLMIDDIQFICGKEATQQEFFHTFNALIDQGKQIILSADKAPGDFEGLDERLRSRLGMGLVAGIQPAPYALRLEILKSKCRQLQRPLPDDVLEFLAQKITASVRELEGALNRLIAHADLTARAMTVESAAEILQDLLRGSCRRVSVEDIQKKVAEHFGIRLADILSPRRARAVARPRQIAMYLSKTMTEHSLPEIGRKFGGRDHTTIIHGVRKIEELMREDAHFGEDVEQIKRFIAA